ncbi:hypothetical protein V8B97DRAFT_1870918 [Scleroderma yunnanense]
MMLSAATPVVLLAVLHAVDNVVPACLADSFYGIFGQQSLFKLTDVTCLDFLPSTSNEGLLVPLPFHQQQLVWIQESSIDDSLRTPKYESEVAQFLGQFHANEPLSSSDAQTVLFDHGASLVHRGDHSAILAVVDEHAVDALTMYLPRFWKAAPIPASPVSFLPVPGTAVQHVRDLLASLHFDPLIAGIVNGISVEQLRKDIRFLTNEDGESGIVSRHSFHEGSRVAARWIKQQFEETGASCRLMSFLDGFAPNVICRYNATTDTSNIVLISGHYDSRGSFGLERAPGGNDDGSGTISVLSIARRIKQTGITFRSNVELVAFAGEEQGLRGSWAYAYELREKGANITLMIQGDMLAYHVPGEPLQLGLPQYIGTPEVAQFAANISAIYSPELKIGLTPVCCSDHQSFHQQGFPATHFFERITRIADPMYHNSGDVSDRPGYDLHQVRSICKVQFATLLHAAGFDLSTGTSLEDSD